MRSGVSIVFLDSVGQVEGFLHGLKSRHGHLPSRLEELFDQPDGLRIYQTWWKAMESRRRCTLTRRLRIEPDRHRARALKSMLQRARLQRAPQALVQSLQMRWNAGVRAVAQQLAQENGLNATWQRRLWPRCDIVTDLAELLNWELLLPALTELSRLDRATRRNIPEPILRARILAGFETHRPTLLHCGTEILHRLDLRLLELGLV